MCRSLDRQSDMQHSAEQCSHFLSLCLQGLHVSGADVQASLDGVRQRTATVIGAPKVCHCTPVAVCCNIAGAS